MCSVGTRIPANADLDDYTTPGTYYVGSASDAASLSHTPITGVGFKLVVFQTGYSVGNYIIQEAMSVSGSTAHRYVRARGTQSWSNDWTLVY